jgi:hypothetical protein
MPSWSQITNSRDAMNIFWELGLKIRNKEIDVGRQHYALSLLHGVRQAVHCGYEKIAAVELGVAGGNGLLELCKAAAYFRNEFAMDIQVYGFDNATGLPPPVDYRDHPELWSQGNYKMPNPNVLREQLPDFAHLIIGDVSETIPEFEERSFGYRLGFVSVDLDYYSSTIAALKILENHPTSYVPAVPVYFDDVEGAITYNPWCGEEGAAKEFNEKHELRKIHFRPNYRILNFSVCHILDHPMRTGKVLPRFPLDIFPF